MYGTVHWPLLSSSYKLEAHIGNVSEDKEALKIIKNNENLKILFDDLPTISEKINNLVIHTSEVNLIKIR
jgi:hypothetical protein